MKWSLRIARIRGIDIRVHATFVLILLLGAVHYGVPYGGAGAVFGVLFMLALFACVVLHELGHSLVAQQLGVSVKEILLLPIGGVARLSREPSLPLHELLIAIAGPLVNVVLSAALVLVALLSWGPGWFADGAIVQAALGAPSLATMLSSLLFANVALAVFNMLPALPMDGGRVFRALLAMALGKLRATIIAATVGQVMAAGLALFGLASSNVVLVLIGAFVFFGASQERASARAQNALSGLGAGEVVDGRALVLSPGDLLGVVAHHAVRAPQAHFAVVHGDRVVGTLSRDDMLRLLSTEGPMAYVAGVMQRELAEIDASTPLNDVRSRLMELGGRPLIVRGPYGYVGLLGMEDLARAAMTSHVLRDRALAPAPVPAPSRDSLF
jgi:Zn-dependent protease